MAKIDIQQYARRGAQARIDELNQELHAIYAAFPDLRLGRSRQARRQTPTPSEGTRRSRRRKMTTAQRKAVSQRMRKYWAERRKTKKAA